MKWWTATRSDRGPQAVSYLNLTNMSLYNRSPVGKRMIPPLLKLTEHTPSSGTGARE